MSKRSPSKPWFVLVLLASASCQSKSPPPPAASASAQSKAPPAVDEALLTDLKTIGKTCQKAAGEDRFKCAGAQNWKLIGDFMGERRERAAAIGTFAAALADAEPGVRGLALSVMHSAFGGAWGRAAAPGKVDAAAARALLDVVLARPAGELRQAMPAAVNATMLTGQEQLLYAALAKPEHAALRASAYPYLMTMGRLRAFSEVQQLTKSSDTSLAEAAVEAPLNMDSWSEAEQDAICQWSDALLADARPSISVKASLLLSHCRGERLDKLLAKAEELAAAGKLDNVAQGPLIAMCGGAQRPKALAATTTQCARSRKILTGVAESKQAEAAARAYAVTWLAQIWPDDASARLLQRLSGDASAEVARQARDSAKRLGEASAQLAAAQSQTAP